MKGQTKNESVSSTDDLIKRLGEMDNNQLLQLAVQLHKDGHLMEAGEIYRRLHAVAPDHPDVLHFYGLLSFQLGETEKGVSLLSQAIAILPTHADAHNNLGNMLQEMQRFEEAEEVYRKVINLQPGHVDAHNNLGVVLKKQGDLAGAAQAFRTAIDRHSEHGDAYHNLAQVLEAQGHYAEAADAARTALRFQTDDTEVLQNLTRALRKAGQIEKAKNTARQWLKLAPDSALAKHTFAALSGEHAPVRAAEAYVQETFDSFAADYDSVLQQLEYSGPEQIKRSLADHLPAPAQQFSILDAGCGTGLCAGILRDFAARLVGVDLSAKMLAKAKKTRCYDHLELSELTAYLSDTQEQFDIIVMADTLTYIGDATTTLAAVSRCLQNSHHRPAGESGDPRLFIFTVEEQHPVIAPGFRLEPTGRYSHSRDYLQQQMAAAGLHCIALESVTLRKECDQPVAGFVVAARPDSDPDRE